jgi:hypothetical protein
MTLATVFVPPWALLITGMITFVEMGLARGLREEEAVAAVLIAGWILGGGHVLLLSLWARSNLLTRFREAAADRYLGPRRVAWPNVRRIAIRFAVAGASIVALLYGVRFVIDLRGNRAWDAALKAYPNFQLQKARPELPAIPDEENLAKAPFFRPFTATGSARKLITWNLNSVARSGFDGEQLSWDWTQRRRMNLAHVEDVYIDRRILKQRLDSPAATVLDGLSEYDGRLEELHKEALARPRLQFPVSTPAVQAQIFRGYGYYSALSSDIRQPALQLVQTFSLRTSARLALGCATNVGDILLSLRLADGVKDLPQSMLQYHEMVLHTVQPIYDGLTLHALKNEDIKKIQDQFATLDLWKGYEKQREEYLADVLNESEALLASWRRHGSWVQRQAPVGMRRKWQAQTLHWGMTELPKVADPKTRRVDPIALRDFQRNRPAPPTGGRYPDQISLAIRSLAFTQTTADQIVVACALERFRNDNGALPQKLDELVPKYLAAVPHDVFTGEPLRYRLNPDGKNYIVYSVGADGIDNHGMAAAMTGSWMLWQDQPNTDWVWNSDAINSPGKSRTNKKSGRN